MPRPVGLEHFGLETDNFDEAVADLKAKGAEFLMEPHEFSPGFMATFIRIPDNIRVEKQRRVGQIGGLEWTQMTAWPLGREQTPEDVGNAVAFFASDDARNITGQALNVNAGNKMN